MEKSGSLFPVADTENQLPAACSLLVRSVAVAGLAVRSKAATVAPDTAAAAAAAVAAASTLFAP